MSLSKAMKNLKFDKRMIEWNLRHGSFSKQELEEHLSSLPDIGDQAVPLDFENDGESGQAPAASEPGTPTFN